MNPDAGAPHGPPDAAPPASLPFELPYPGGLAALSDMLTGGLPVGERPAGARSRRLALSLAARLRRADRREGVSQRLGGGGRSVRQSRLRRLQQGAVNHQGGSGEQEYQPYQEENPLRCSHKSIGRSIRKTGG